MKKPIGWFRVYIKFYTLLHGWASKQRSVLLRGFTTSKYPNEGTYQFGRTKSGSYSKFQPSTLGLSILRYCHLRFRIRLVFVYLFFFVDWGVGLVLQIDFVNSEVYRIRYFFFKHEDPHGGHAFWTRWWFQILFIFTPIWGRFPFWLIFFRWVETTN